jgi:hypothetical protein
MNIKDFFQHRAGTWSSQRTSHDPAIARLESGNTVIQVEIADISDPKVAELCQRYDFSSSNISALKINWYGAIDKNKPKGSTMLVAIADEGSDRQGKLLQLKQGETTPVMGRYVMEANDVLSLATELDSLTAEEKIWFPRPNICMRASVTSGKSNIASYCTEIRKVESAK